MAELRKIKRALLSVSDKTGLAEFAKALTGFGVELISTGGTAKFLRDNDLEVTDVSTVTGFPEMMDGRVKTLHPKIHGAFLALRDNAEHVASMKEHSIEPIDLVVINLYPFEQTVAKEGEKELEKEIPQEKVAPAPAAAPVSATAAPASGRMIVSPIAARMAAEYGIDPLGTDSANKQYGIPASNPFAADGKDDTLGEIYAYGVRNPQRFSWDAKTGAMYVADIGQNIVEEISPVTAGANLGWNKWEGSFPFVSREGVGTANLRGEAGVTYPIAEYDHRDPLFQRVAVTGVYAYRQPTVRALTNKLIFGDNPSGEMFYVDADNLPKGGQDPIRRIMFNDKGTAKTLLQLIREKNASQGKPAAPRVDLRLGMGPQGQLFVMNKRDGTIRMIVP